MRRLIFSGILALSLGMGATAFGRKEPAELERDQYFRCQGLEYIDTLSSSQPGKALLQLKQKAVKITGVFMFADSEVAIISETDAEILFDGRVSGTVLGSFGVFNKATGQLRADTNHGEPQKVTHHTWGEYACKPVKF